MRKWRDAAAHEAIYLFGEGSIDSIIRVLSHQETRVESIRHPLDKVGISLAASLGSKYEPQTLSKSRENQSLKYFLANQITKKLSNTIFIYTVFVTSYS